MLINIPSICLKQAPEHIGLTGARKDKYLESLAKVATTNKEIILALTDKNYIDMAINFYETSIKPLKIDNMLFISLSQATCDPLVSLGMHCFAYSEHDPSEDVDAVFGDPIFKHKMNVRASFIMDALRWGYKVLLTDVDVVLFKNPFPYFTCSECDMECLEDGSLQNLNAGFLFMRPTKMAMKTYQTRIDLTDLYKDKTDQMLFNLALKLLKDKVKVRALPRDQFPCGKCYFEGPPRRDFVDDSPPCETCVAFHNNWILSKEAKVYRFQEQNLWLYEGADNYYSSDETKFLVYDNPLTFQYSFLWNLLFWRKDNANYEHEISALKNALAIGRITNRVVILPKFHNYLGEDCSILDLLYFAPFDRSFHGAYREYSFMSHPKVPQSIKDAFANTQSLNYVIATSNSNYASITKTHQNTKIIQIKDQMVGATSNEIQAYFAEHSDIPVIRFQHLYGAFSHFDSKQHQEIFNSDVQRGFYQTSAYRQYKVNKISTK